MNKTFLSVVIVVLVVAGVLFYSYYRDYDQVSTVFDSFAKCLNEKNWTMYGTKYCPFCKEEKILFGSSFQYVNYVECTEQTEKCKTDGIITVPTWILTGFSSTSPDKKMELKRLNGLQELDALSKESGCPLPEVSK
jgi:hypothetical protein